MVWVVLQALGVRKRRGQEKNMGWQVDRFLLADMSKGLLGTSPVLGTEHLGSKAHVVCPRPVGRTADTDAGTGDQ